MRRFAVAAFALLLAGCGGGHTGEGNKATSVATPPAPFGECDIFAADQAVNIHIAGDGAEASCAATVRAFGRRGEYWSTSGSRTNGNNDVRACSFTNDVVTVDVYDIIGGSSAQRICAGLAGQGWTDLGP